MASTTTPTTDQRVVIALGDDTYLGRYNLTDPLGPVPATNAYVYADADDATRAARAAGVTPTALLPWTVAL